MSGAIPSKVCLRSGLPAAGASLVAGCGGAELTALGRGASDDCLAATGGSERCGMSGAMPSRVCLRRGLLAAANSDAGCAAGPGSGAGTGGGSGAGGKAADVSGAIDGAAVTAAGGADGTGAATISGTAASSAPHSASMSSVGGAIEGRGGRALGWVLSDRLSFIVVRPQRHHQAFSRPAAQIKPPHHPPLQNASAASPRMHVSVRTAVGRGGQPSGSVARSARPSLLGVVTTIASALARAGATSPTLARADHDLPPRP
jgi:hypothetical protein